MEEKLLQTFEIVKEIQSDIKKMKAQLHIITQSREIHHNRYDIGATKDNNRGNYGDIDKSEFIHREVIKENYEDLVENLDLRKTLIIDYLIEEGCLTEGEASDIQTRPERKTQNRGLCSVLSRRSRHSFDRFIQSIKRDYPELSDILQQNYTKRLLEAPLFTSCLACTIKNDVELHHVIDKLYSNSIVDLEFVDSILNAGSMMNKEIFWDVVFRSINRPPNKESKLTVLREALSGKFSHISSKLDISQQTTLRCQCVFLNSSSTLPNSTSSPSLTSSMEDMSTTSSRSPQRASSLSSISSEDEGDELYFGLQRYSGSFKSTSMTASSRFHTNYLYESEAPFENIPETVKDVDMQTVSDMQIKTSGVLQSDSVNVSKTIPGFLEIAEYLKKTPITNTSRVERQPCLGSFANNDGKLPYKTVAASHSTNQRKKVFRKKRSKSLPPQGDSSVSRKEESGQMKDTFRGVNGLVETPESRLNVMIGEDLTTRFSEDNFVRDLKIDLQSPLPTNGNFSERCVDYSYKDEKDKSGYVVTQDEHIYNSRAGLQVTVPEQRYGLTFESAADSDINWSPISSKTLTPNVEHGNPLYITDQEIITPSKFVGKQPNGECATPPRKKERQKDKKIKTKIFYKFGSA